MTTSPHAYAKALYLVLRPLEQKDAKTTLARFVAHMSAKGLAPILPDILAALPDAARIVEGLQRIEVRSQTSFSEKDISLLLEAMDIPEDKAEIVSVEDENVVTGFTANTHDMILNHTLSGRLSALRKALS